MSVPVLVAVWLLVLCALLAPVEIKHRRNERARKLAAAGDPGLGLGDHQPARGNLANVTFDTFGAIGQTFSVRVMHGVGNRRGPLFFTDCYSDTVANGLTMRFVGVDGIHITRHRQPAGRGVNIYEFHEYTDAWIDGIAA